MGEEGGDLGADEDGGFTKEIEEGEERRGGDGGGRSYGSRLERLRLRRVEATNCVLRLFSHIPIS